jgi:glycosyltransferase involved in cell wall biosynthesis
MAPMLRFEKAVLQVIPALDAGGAERTTIEMTAAIVAAGGRALVATSGGRLAIAVEKAGGRVIPMPVQSKNPLTILVNRGRLIRLIREEGVDIVHARSRAPAWSALMAARATGVAFVTTYHGAYSAGSALKRFANSAMARADLVIANSDYTAGLVRASYDVGGRLKVIHRGADLADFNPEAIEVSRIAAVKARWELEPRPALVLLLPGRLTDWKGHEVAIRAAALLKAKAETGLIDDFRLVFVGDDQGRTAFSASLLRGVSELGLERMIRWVGHCDDMPAAYALSDIVLSPSTRPEAFGRVAAEAGAMARVAIGADHGGARETIVDGETGFLVAPGSPDSLASAIERAVALGPDGRAAMGARARARIKKKFSTAAMTAATIAAYAELLSGRGVRLS